MIAFVFILLGLIVGSFLNVVIHRVPLRRSVVWPASRCPGCAQPISPEDNIPLLSYVLLRGRCRSCGMRIPVRYPLVEALTGLLFGAAYLRFELSIDLLWALVLIAVLISLGAIDLEHKLLPNAIVGPASLAGFLLSVARDPSGWWVYPVSAAALAAGLLVLALSYRGGMGMGDVKMGGMLGAFLGPYGALAVFLGALGGSVVGGILIVAGKVRRRYALPFGVFMAIGGIGVLFAGPELWKLYLHTLGGL